MLSAACEYGGLSNLCLFDEDMDSVMHSDIIGTGLLHFREEAWSDPFLLQQDGASVHRSNHTMALLD